MASSAMTGTNLFRHPEDQYESCIKKKMILTMIAITNALLGNEKVDRDMSKYFDNTDVFPNSMGDELASKLPKTVLFTAEFDFYRRDVEELATLLEKNGSLLDYCCHPGGLHCTYVMQDTPVGEMFYPDSTKMFNKYLK